ncbi:uncharacterized protein DS421_15g504890 [Arachis hypogaea]|nr:uncharacterized protein DS421_15g504890 [Arachis hypogaea]
MAEKSDSGGRLCYPSTIFRLCDKAGVVFEDENPEWIKVGIPITVQRMHAVASPLPQRRIRKRPMHQVVEGQNLKEQAPLACTNYRKPLMAYLDNTWKIKGYRKSFTYS